MDNISPEVLIYLQNVKGYLKSNKEANDYFLGESNEELFFHHLVEISQKNFEENGEVMLNRDQFEVLRKTIMALTISQKEFDEKPELQNEEKVFMDLGDFGKICLN
jgi:hypothetical protein